MLCQMVIYLSTPSLGITCCQGEKGTDRYCFQLPLSGSQGRRGAPAEKGFTSTFQLPLSGSQTKHTGFTPENAWDWLNFQLPLSGSHQSKADSADPRGAGFQLPLSGSLYAVSVDVSYVVRMGIFQLPLSGSPSPIPGFSGSPRLSAAAPPRTSVFSGHYLKI